MADEWRFGERVFPLHDLTLPPRDRRGPTDADAARKTPDAPPAAADEDPESDAGSREAPRPPP